MYPELKDARRVVNEYLKRMQFINGMIRQLTAIERKEFLATPEGTEQKSYDSRCRANKSRERIRVIKELLYHIEKNPPDEDFTEPYPGYNTEVVKDLVDFLKETKN